jgi:hypothetical protein
MGNDVYPPELMKLMSAAFDAAYDKLLLEPSQALQLQFATRIMTAVNDGERDLQRLTAVALGQTQGEPESAEQAPLPLPDEPSSAA